MNPTSVLCQLDALIDSLLSQGDLPASSVASMLMAARSSVEEGYHVALARVVWDAGNSMRAQYAQSPQPHKLMASAGERHRLDFTEITFDEESN